MIMSLTDEVTGQKVLRGNGRRPEERAYWIRKHVKDRIVTQRYRRLAAANGRLLAILRSSELDVHREGP
jgi:hypothetical protein